MRIRRRSFKTQYVKPKSLRLRLIFYKFFTDKINAKIYKRYLTVIINPHAPDRFTPSRACCAEKCGSALTNR